LETNFLDVLRDHTAGDPMRTEIRWTDLTRREIRTNELQAWFVSEHVVETPLVHAV
jgi:hypothetical protein